MTEQQTPKDYPPHHYTAVAVPSDFARVLVVSAAKSGILFEDQLLKWAQMGAECSRLHEPKTTRSGRSKR